ncbi:MAG: type VI secretion system tube protein Hcp, partial [Thermoanaerobaculia bacterium]
APVVVGSISFDGGVAIPIYDVNGSFENPVSIGSATGGAGAGKVKFNEFTIKKTVDASSPVLFTKLATGAHFAQVVLTIHRQSASDATLTLGTVFLTSLSHETAPDPVKTLEKVGMVFGSAALAADGATACWNQVNNEACP